MKHMIQIIKNNDQAIAAIFVVLSLVFVCVAFAVPAFFDWVFSRHENVLSWYIRPVFLIPFCIFAYYRSLTGISLTIFLLLTSMFWFAQPAETSEQVKEFLVFEKDYLLNDWSVAKAAVSLLVPASMTLLAFAFWKRNLWLGFATMALIAIVKVGWSVVSGGESGASIFVPAIVGLIACSIFIYFGLRRSGEKN